MFGSTKCVLRTPGSSKLILGALILVLKMTSVLEAGPDTISRPDLGSERVGGEG